MPDLVPVEHDPFGDAPYPLPVDHVPEFGDAPVLRTGSIGAPERAPGESVGGIALDLLSQIPGAVRGALSLPQRAFGASENMRTGGPYDPGPALEAATMTMGATPLGAARGGGEAAFGAGPVLPRGTLDEFRSYWDGQGVRHWIADRPQRGEWQLSDLVVPKEQRGQGIGSQFMKELTDLADANGRRLTLTAAKDYGTSSLSRLKDFYKQFGFVENRGRNKDFTISDSMYREPQSGTTIGSGPTDSKAAGAAMMAAPQGIRAYHGSPYDFERFDVSKIGTGEGAQAYGHGLYFAENPAVAREYKRTVGSQWRLDDPPEKIASAIMGNAGSKEAALRYIDRVPSYTEGNPSMMEARRLIESDTPLTSSPGKTYEVSINADPEHFLDWDKPLSEQPHIADKLVEAGYHIPRTSGDLSYLEKMAAEHGPDSWYALQLNSVRSAMKKPGSEFVPKRPEDMQALRSAGIPGIKYLDQGSRSAGTPAEIAEQKQIAEKARAAANAQPGNDFLRQLAEAQEYDLARLSKPTTRNYVLFRDDIIDILRKYGLAGLSALPPAVAASVHKKMFQPVDHDPFQ